MRMKVIGTMVCLTGAFLYQGCRETGPGAPETISHDCTSWLCDCPAPYEIPPTPIHGVRSDGRVDVSAKEAWPDRPRSPSPPFTPDELARGCAALSVCIPKVGVGTNFVDCLAGAPGGIEVNAAERVIPIMGSGAPFRLE